MTKRSLVLVSASALASLVACGFPSSSNSPDEGEKVEVLVAKKSIPKHFSIDETMVRTERIPKRYVQPKSLRRPDELLGQVAGATIFEGSQTPSASRCARSGKETPWSPCRRPPLPFPAEHAVPDQKH